MEMMELIETTKVRKTPSWPRSWANSSLFPLCSHRNAWANRHLLGRPKTFSRSKDEGWKCRPGTTCGEVGEILNWGRLYYLGYVSLETIVVTLFVSF